MDGTGQPARLTQFHAAATSNPERTKKAIAEAAKPDNGYETPVGGGEKAGQLRKPLEIGLRAVQNGDGDEVEERIGVSLA